MTNEPGVAALTRRTPASSAVVGWGLTITALFVTGVLALMSSSGYDTWGAVFVGPVLFAVSLPILARQARREGDRRLFWLLVAALVVKLAAAIVAHFVAYEVYQGVVDAKGYHLQGAKLAERFRSGNFDTGLPTITGTNFPTFLNGLVYTVIGPTKLGGFLFHSWLGFWGLFLFYRAFTIALPEGRSRSYARLLFFLPSQVMWSSLMGKDPWMVLSLGVGCYGIARALTGKTWRGLAVFGLGAWMMGLIRPHIAGMAVLALGVAYLARRSRPHLRQLAPVVGGLGLAAVALLAVVLIGRTQHYLDRSGVETKKGLTTAVQQAGAEGGFGGSVFQPSVVRSPRDVPVAAVTVLFRPFVNEAKNWQGLAAALEGSFLIFLTLARIRGVLAGLRSIRRQPYVAFAAAYTGLFVFAFSGFANFGLLARQRVQLLPVFLVLLAIPAPAKARRPAT